MRALVVAQSVLDTAREILALGKRLEADAVDLLKRVEAEAGLQGVGVTSGVPAMVARDPEGRAAHAAGRGLASLRRRPAQAGSSTTAAGDLLEGAPTVVAPSQSTLEEMPVPRCWDWKQGQWIDADKDGVWNEPVKVLSHCPGCGRLGSQMRVLGSERFCCARCLFGLGDEAAPTGEGEGRPA